MQGSILYLYVYIEKNDIKKLYILKITQQMFEFNHHLHIHVERKHHSAFV